MESHSSHRQGHFVCSQCNKSLENERLLIFHTLAHKLNQNIEAVSKNINTSEIESGEFSDKLSTSDTVHNTPDNHHGAESLDTFTGNLSESSVMKEAPSSNSFSSPGCDFFATIERSLITMSLMSSRLHAGLDWRDVTVPEGLKKLVNDVLKFSSGVTDISKYLLLVLETNNEFEGDIDYGDNQYNNDINGNDNDEDYSNEYNEQKYNNVMTSSEPEQEVAIRRYKSRRVTDLNIKHVGSLHSNKSVKTKPNDFKEELTVDPNTNTKKNAREKEKKDFICGECGKQFSRNYCLKRHKTVHQEKYPFQCKVCPLKFKSQTRLEKHSSVHVNKNGYKCDFCVFSSRTLIALRQHSGIEHRGVTQQFSCNMCSHKAKTSYDLAYHETSHKPKTCKRCDYEAKDANELHLHNRSSHPILSCRVCDYTCFTSSQLKNHERRHRKAEDVNATLCCELCGFTSDTRQKLSYHMRRHSNKTPFSCPHCEYKCSSRTSFTAHTLNHAGVRPYVCKICGADFVRSSYLTKHYQIHSDEKKHACKICGKSFKDVYNMKQHELIHSGDKRFKCHFCYFACRRKKRLDLHLSTEHEAGDCNGDVLESRTESDDTEIVNTTMQCN